MRKLFKKKKKPEQPTRKIPSSKPCNPAEIKIAGEAVGFAGSLPQGHRNYLKEYREETTR